LRKLEEQNIQQQKESKENTKKLEDKIEQTQKQNKILQDKADRHEKQVVMLQKQNDQMMTLLKDLHARR